MNRWLHLGAIWVVMLTAYASAYWILVANGLMQNPVGAEVRDGRLELVDLGAVLTNPSGLTAFWHVVAGGLVTAGFVMAGVSAYHLFRRTEHTEFFRRSLRIGMFTSLPALFVAVTFGGLQLSLIEDIQPMKAAMFGGDAAEVGRLQAMLVEQLGPGDYEPPSLARGAGLLMIFMFAAMMWLVIGGTLLAFSRRIVARFRAWHVVLMASIPLPYVAMVSGWVFREVGRQPWVVYQALTVEDAVSDISAGAMRASLLTFTTVFAVLITVTVWLLARHARRGPDVVALGRPPEPGRADPSDAILTFVGR